MIFFNIEDTIKRRKVVPGDILRVVVPDERTLFYYIYDNQSWCFGGLKENECVEWTFLEYVNAPRPSSAPKETGEKEFMKFFCSKTCKNVILHEEHVQCCSVILTRE